MLGEAKNRVKHQYMIIAYQGLQKLGTKVVQQLLRSYELSFDETNEGELTKQGCAGLRLGRSNDIPSVFNVDTLVNTDASTSLSLPVPDALITGGGQQIALSSNIRTTFGSDAALVLNFSRFDTKVHLADQIISTHKIKK